MSGAFECLRILWERLPRRGRSDKIALLLCCLGAFLCAGWVSAVAFDHVHPDFRNGYYPGALSLQRSGAYVDGAGRLITHWPPGYSLFISPFVTDSIETTLQRLRWVSAGTAVLWVLALHRLIRRAAPSVPPCVPLYLAVFWPPMLGIGNVGYSEWLLAAVLAGAALLLAALMDSSRLTLRGVAGAALTGVLLGFAALIKTLALPVAGLALGAVLWGARRCRVDAVYALIAGLAFAGVIAPWMLTYWGHTGHVGFTTAGSAAFQDGLARFPHSAAAQRLLECMPGAAGSADAAARGWHVVRETPLGALQLLFQKTVLVWSGTYSGRHQVLLALCNVPWLILFAAASVAALRRPTWASPLHAFLLGSVWAVWLMAAAVLPLFRYLSGTFPFVVIAVAAWLSNSRLRRGLCNLTGNAL